MCIKFAFTNTFNLKSVIADGSDTIALYHVNTSKVLPLVDEADDSNNLMKRYKLLDDMPLGAVVSIYPGADGIVLLAAVKTATGIFKQPVMRLCPLPAQ
ncbi:hypothetical protein EVAR_10717_1 [Eumeta japonica]|uniref:DUF5641 domain-containing protein n=1 Tax=Eumeta variegata TaxID=151549 RepID=A0A4C1U7X3_EUMVA|nr:hypothetical protein EVAR_10717_1 [Eumeta japonica]